MRLTAWLLMFDVGGSGRLTWAPTTNGRKFTAPDSLRRLNFGPTEQLGGGGGGAANQFRSSSLSTVVVVGGSAQFHRSASVCDANETKSRRRRRSFYLGEANSRTSYCRYLSSSSWPQLASVCFLLCIKRAAATATQNVTAGAAAAAAGADVDAEAANDQRGAEVVSCELRVVSCEEKRMSRK